MTEAAVGDMLRRRGWTCAVAESCTGGLVADRITDVPGSSDYFVGGIVAYSNDVKEILLHVDGEVLQAHGAVSEPAARAMALGVRQALGTDVGLSTTGIAGPAGATPYKPVGLVYTGLATPDGCWTWRDHWSGDRRAVKEQAAQAALAMLHQYLESGSAKQRG